MSGEVPTGGSVASTHSWRLYSDAGLGDQVTGTMAQYPTQSHYPDTVLTSPTTPSRILLMPITRLYQDKYKFYK